MFVFWEVDEISKMQVGKLEGNVGHVKGMSTRLSQDKTSSILPTGGFRNSQRFTRTSMGGNENECPKIIQIRFNNYQVKFKF